VITGSMRAACPALLLAVSGCAFAFPDYAPEGGAAGGAGGASVTTVVGQTAGPTTSISSGAGPGV